mmetsp:Transcript_15463/g.58595  ORF Transcript_15463/g.58595 Transcript_15463/m.58595 type:complete len:207 (-) Transcript_15463:2399-3019(-)
MRAHAHLAAAKRGQHARASEAERNGRRSEQRQRAGQRGERAGGGRVHRWCVPGCAGGRVRRGCEGQAAPDERQHPARLAAVRARGGVARTRAQRHPQHERLPRNGGRPGRLGGRQRRSGAGVERRCARSWPGASAALALAEGLGRSVCDWQRRRRSNGGPRVRCASLAAEPWGEGARRRCSPAQRVSRRGVVLGEPGHASVVRAGR